MYTIFIYLDVKLSVKIIQFDYWRFYFHFIWLPTGTTKYLQYILQARIYNFPETHSEFQNQYSELFPITSNGYLHWSEGLSIMQSYKIFKMSWGFYLFISLSAYEYHTIVRNYYYIQSKSDKGINVCVFLLASIAYEVE